MDPGKFLLLHPPPPLNMDPGKFLLLPPPPPLNPFGQNSVCPPKWMLARTPMPIVPQLFPLSETAPADNSADISPTSDDTYATIPAPADNTADISATGDDRDATILTPADNTADISATGDDSDTTILTSMSPADNTADISPTGRDDSYATILTSMSPAAQPSVSTTQMSVIGSPLEQAMLSPKAKKRNSIPRTESIQKCRRSPSVSPRSPTPPQPASPRSPTPPPTASPPPLIDDESNKAPAATELKFETPEARRLRIISAAYHETQKMISNLRPIDAQMTLFENTPTTIHISVDIW